MLDLLFKTMEQPKPFGLFHLTFFAGVILILILLIKYYKNSSDKTFRRILLVCWVIIVAMEIGKQIINNYDPNLKIWLPYNYSAFPFQFCSLPFYTLPLLIFLKDSKFRDLLLVFSATFIFFGGFGYFFFPVSFCEYTFINVQTMVHHGIQVITGIFIFSHEYEKMEYKKVVESLSLLIVSIFISMILNVIFYYVSSDPTSVNMMELSPINPTKALVFSNILNATNYFVYLLVYIFGFLMFSSISFEVMKLIRRIIDNLNNRNNEKDDLATNN